MKRTNKSGKAEVATNQDQKPRWKKITRGTLYPFPDRRNRRVRTNEVIEATEEEIQRHRKDFELVKDGTGVYKIKTEKGKPAPLKKIVVKDHYELIPIGEGLYNVVSLAGKVMNDSGLRLEDAEKLKASLEEITVEEDN